MWFVFRELKKALDKSRKHHNMHFNKLCHVCRDIQPHRGTGGKRGSHFVPPPPSLQTTLYPSLSNMYFFNPDVVQK